MWSSVLSPKTATVLLRQEPRRGLLQLCRGGKKYECSKTVLAPFGIVSQSNFTCSSCKNLLGSGFRFWTFQILDLSLTNPSIYLTELLQGLRKRIYMKVCSVELCDTERIVSRPRCKDNMTLFETVGFCFGCFCFVWVFFFLFFFLTG